MLAAALDTAGFKAVLVICTVGQLFCGLACLTSASRMCFAFSRDRGMPGSRHLSKVNKDGVPFNAVMAMAALALIITIPALYGAPGTVLPVAFFAVISICVIGLYVCYAIPIFLRWRMGNEFEQASAWNLGSKWRWMNPISFIWVAIICHRRPAADEPARGAVGRPVGRELRELRAARAPGDHRRSLDRVDPGQGVTSPARSGTSTYRSPRSSRRAPRTRSRNLSVR